MKSFIKYPRSHRRNNFDGCSFYKGGFLYKGNNLIYKIVFNGIIPREQMDRRYIYRRDDIRHYRYSSNEVWLFEDKDEIIFNEKWKLM